MLKNVMGGHPKGLFLLFSVEMWERFSYYGMRALLVLYLIQYLFQGMDDKLATQYAGNIYGWYTGLVYLTPLLGGYLADRYLGQRKCISIGALVMAIGLFILAASGFECFKSIALILFVLGLVLMVIANGFFKSNISTIVGMLYGDDKQKRDAGFTIFYMGINLGAFFSPLICGTLAHQFGFKYGFMAAGLGIIIGYITYKLGEHRLLGDLGLKALPQANKELSAEEKAKANRKLTLHEKRRIYALFILMLFSIFFWICFEQAGCSFNLFAEYSTQRQIGNFVIPASWFQSCNPLFIITLAPVMSMLWSFLASKGKEPTSVVKFCIALGLISLSALIMALAAHCTNGGQVLVSPWWLIFTYLAATLAELCLSPIGLSLVTKLAPVQFASILMGTWFLSSFFGNLIAGVFAGFYDHINHTTFFLILAAAALTIAIVLTAIRPVLKLWMGKN